MDKKQEKSAKQSKEKPVKENKQKSSNFKHVIRIANTDINGNKAIIAGLTKIKGVNESFSNAVVNVLDLPKNTKMGSLNDKQKKDIEDLIENPKKYNFPDWMLNRRKDPETGETNHLTRTKLELTKENDIKILRKIKCYKGVRHSKKLPLRGQRTKSNFRNKRAKAKKVGVKRKGKGKK